MLPSACSPYFTPKSMSRTPSTVTSRPFTLQVMPLSIANTTVTSSPRIRSNRLPGTSVVPFISTVISSPAGACFASSRMTSQPSLPFSPLRKGLASRPSSTASALLFSVLPVFLLPVSTLPVPVLSVSLLSVSLLPVSLLPVSSLPVSSLSEPPSLSFATVSV